MLLALTDKMALVDGTFGSGMSDCDSSVDEIDDSFDANDNTIIHDCDDDDLDDSYDGSDDSYVDKDDRKARTGKIRLEVPIWELPSKQH